MGKKCIYCKAALEDGSVIDFCTGCGVGVWGPKMFETIKRNMENAREAGDLYQGSVTSAVPSPPKSFGQSIPPTI